MKKLVGCEKISESLKASLRQKSEESLKQGIFS
jgi:hypothetical protein